MSSLSLIVGTLLMTSGCNDPNLEADKLPFSISYNIINKDGVKTNKIEQNENFVFNLVVKNDSNEDWYISTQSLISSNFTELYKKSNTGADSLVGSAYLSALCSFEAGVMIPANGNYQVDIPWVADKSLTNVPSCGLNTKDNSYLPAGEYFTKIKGFIKIFRSEITHEIPLDDYNLIVTIQ